MRKTSTHTPIVPPGWTGDRQAFNNWQKHLQVQLDKILNTKIAKKYII